MRKYLFFILLTVGFIISCNKNDDSTPINNGDYSKDFETIWQNFDKHYVFFSHKNIDWTETYDKYASQVEKIDNYNDFITLIKNMLVPLKDVHVWIQKSNGQRVQPYFPNYTVNWDSRIWQNYISDYNWHQESSSWGWFKQDSIGYFNISNWNADEITLEDFDAALDSMRSCKGIIIDIRTNGGGYGPLAGSIGGRFVNDKFHCGYLQLRNGNDHNNFTDMISIEYPKRGDWQFTKTIVLLIGRGCFSTSEIFASGMTKLDNCVVIGDTTGGGLSNSKQFSLSDGTIYSVSDQLIMDTDKNIVESKGIAPHIFVDWNSTDISAGIDPVFDYALDLLINE
jgi:hypothetical protein